MRRLRAIAGQPHGPVTLFLAKPAAATVVFNGRPWVVAFTRPDELFCQLQLLESPNGEAQADLLPKLTALSTRWPAYGAPRARCSRQSNWESTFITWQSSSLAGLPEAKPSMQASVTHPLSHLQSPVPEICALDAANSSRFRYTRTGLLPNGASSQAPVGRGWHLANCGGIVNCSASLCGATSRCATSKRCSGWVGPSCSRSRRSCVFSVVFGRLAHLASDGVPYPAFCLAGLLPWMLFAAGVTSAANSLVGNVNLLTKVYFPRILLPLSNVVSGLRISRCRSCSRLSCSPGMESAPSARLLLLPLPVALVLATAAGAGLWLAALNARYRDVRHALPFLVQMWMYGTPIVYSLGSCRVYGSPARPSIRW